MQLTEEIIVRVISGFYRKCETAQAIGLPLYKVVDGEPVPSGWILDQETLYYLPPNVKLL